MGSEVGGIPVDPLIVNHKFLNHDGGKSDTKCLKKRQSACLVYGLISTEIPLAPPDYRVHDQAQTDSQSMQTDTVQSQIQGNGGRLVWPRSEPQSIKASTVRRERRLRALGVTRTVNKGAASIRDNMHH